MVRNLINLLFFLLPLFCVAQKEGTITYQETVKLNIRIPEGMEEVFAKFPKNRSSDKTLYFKGKESLYSNKIDNIGDEDDHVSMQEGGFHLEFKMEEPDNRTYTNLSDKKLIRQQDLLGKTFLISEEPKTYNWKIGSDMQKVLDYVCMNATAEINDSTSVVAWFSTQLPVPLGPRSYSGLPGMILALEYNGDERIIVATEINLDPLSEGAITIPKKGKKVSASEFEKIRDEKMKEMQAEHGGPGVHIITRHR